jgi:hypothetical protein
MSIIVNVSGSEDIKDKTMNIFEAIVNRVTGKDILCLEVSKDSDGNISLSNSIDGIPVRY